MVQKIYNVKDTKAEYFLSPFYATSEEIALRQIRSAVLDDGHPFNKNPQDFDLYECGEFDDITGIFQMLDSPRHMLKLDTFASNQLQLPIEE